MKRFWLKHVGTCKCFSKSADHPASIQSGLQQSKHRSNASEHMSTLLKSWCMEQRLLGVIIHTVSDGYNRNLSWCAICVTSHMPRTSSRPSLSTSTLQRTEGK